MKHPRPYCDGISRRDMLRAGVLGGGFGLRLPNLLQAEEKQQGQGKDVSVIIVFLEGGLSTIDTLDLKPDAPVEFRGDFNPISTNVPGIQVCEHLPNVAKVTDQFSLIRSFAHGNSSHGLADHWMLTGYAPTAGFQNSLLPNNQRPSHGSIIARKKGLKGNVPPYVCLPKMHNSAGSAYLGSSYAPFVVESDPSSPKFSVPDLTPPLEVNASRLGDRHNLLKTVDRFRESQEIVQANEAATQLQTFQQKALGLMTSRETRHAFDINQESATVRDEYGRTSLGQSCLLARRLVQAGVRCVTIDHTNWDTHYNNFHVLKTDLLPQLDMALPSLLADLKTQGLYDSTLVLVMGEFGRTPRVNKHAGRDHWGPSNTILLAGGGIQGGRVVGKTNSKGEHPDGATVTPEDLAATMYHLLGINHDDVFHTPEGRPVKIVNDGKVIHELL